MKYLKKPVVVEAMQYDGKLTDVFQRFLEPAHKDLRNPEHIMIRTCRGWRVVENGDWIVNGEDGYEVCEKDLFDEYYEPLGE